MRITIVNDVWHPSDTTPSAALERFVTLTGWANAIQAHGADVSVVQRFHEEAQFVRGDVAYDFVVDGALPRPSTWFRGSRAFDARVANSRPDVVHVNGLDYPRRIRRLRQALPARCAVVVQDHGGFDPAALSFSRRAWMRYGLRGADTLLVATPPQIDVFRVSGIVPGTVRVRDVMEGSTTLRAAARSGNRRPLAILWVGRLTANKDPLTVLEGFARFAVRTPDAELTFVYGAADFETDVRARIDAEPALRARVRMAGAVAHDDLARFYAAADLFVLGSHREGSGYAALEAMACGVVPVLTDIPSFRWLTGDGRVGALWSAGDPAALAAALERVAAQPIAPQSAAARDRFEQQFTWDAIGRRAMTVYRELSRD